MDKSGLISIVVERTQEEREMLLRALVRAKRMYGVYMQQDCVDDCLEFSQYANCFHGIPEDCATSFWQTGEVN